MYRIAEYQHVKPGKGGAFVRTKLRNVTTGAQADRTFRPEEKFEQLRTENRAMTYLYDEPEQLVFMDAESFEQLGLPKSLLRDRLDLMTLNMQVEVDLHRRRAVRCRTADVRRLESGGYGGWG